MDDSFNLARHAACLVSLLIRQPEAVDQQKLELRTLALMTTEGTVRLSTREGQLVANGLLVPAVLAGVRDMADQLNGHGVESFEISQGMSPGEMLALARILAEPVGADWTSIHHKVRAVGATTITVNFREPVVEAAAAEPAVPEPLPGSHERIPFILSRANRGGDGRPIVPHFHETAFAVEQATREGRTTAVMEQARRQFLSATRGTLDAFDQLAAQLASQPSAEQLLTPLRRELHRLNGSAATFGYPRVGRMAAALEGAVKKWVADPNLDRDRRGPIVARFARSLREQLMTGAETTTVPGRRLLIVGLRDDVAVPLTTEASARGYQVERVSADELDEALEDGAPQAVIASDATKGLEELQGVARLLLRKREAGGAPASGPVVAGPAGIRMLDVRTEPSEVLDALEAVADFEREAIGSVLAVDDDPVMRTIVRVAAEQLNLSIETVADPAAFRATLGTLVPSLVVIDVDLGGTSGLDLVREVRAMPTLANIPVLVLSGHADVGTRDAAFSAGADDYMLKPFAPAEFQRRVGALFDVTRRRLASTGIHASSGVSLPSRTLRELDAELAQRGRSDVCIAVIAPTDAPSSPRATSAWHRECGRIAAAVTGGGGIAGLIDELTVAVLMKGKSVPAVAWLSAQAGERPEHSPPWTAGIIAGAALGPEATVVAILAAAREARNAAREADVPACEWNADDADVAPDVVVVEDDAALADLIVFALETRGLTHRRYADGISALEGLLRMRSRTGRTMILLDVDLPGLDGHSLHERLRIARPGQFDVTFLSAHGTEAEQLRALQAGAVDYLLKPVSLRILAAKLSGWRTRAKQA